MDDRAIINGKSVLLNADEVKGAAEFHKSRIAFGDVYGLLRFNTDPLDDRDHQHWICEDYNMEIADFENIIRGYIVDGEIYFYTGSDFRCVSEHKITLEMIKNIIEVYKNHFSNSDVIIYNGVIIGKVGERWAPKNKLLDIKLR